MEYRVSGSSALASHCSESTADLLLMKVFRYPPTRLEPAISGVGLRVDLETERYPTLFDYDKRWDDVRAVMGCLDASE